MDHLPQPCLLLYSLSANLVHSLIMRLTVLTLSPHNLHLLFCWVLSILALKLLSLWRGFVLLFENILFLSELFPFLAMFTFSNLRFQWIEMYFHLRSFFEQFYIFSHIAYSFGFSLMLSWLPYFAPIFFFVSLDQVAGHFSWIFPLFAGRILIRWFVMFFFSCLYCFTLSRYLLNLPSFARIFWFISKSFIPLSYHFCFLNISYLHFPSNFPSRLWVSVSFLKENTDFFTD